MKSTKLDTIFADHYRAVATYLLESNLLLDNEKNAEAKATMQEAARCLNEAADRLEK